VFVKRLAILTLSTVALALSGCPIIGGSKFTVGGTVTGLQGSGLVLELNAGGDLGFSASGSFVFGDHLVNNAAYSVTVRTQPSNPAQTCSVRNGSGTINKASITNVIVSCTQTGRFASVANRQSNTISGFGIDPASGALLPLAGSPFAAGGTAPAALSVDPNGQFLFVANNTSNTVAVFSINATTGGLTAIATPTVVGSAPEALIVDPTDHFLYVANLAANTVSAFLINNGVLTPVAGSPFATGSEPASLAIDANGNFLYAVNFTGNSVTVFLIDQAAGILSAVSGSPFATGTGPLSIAIDPTDAFAYIANEGADSISEYSLNASTGALAPVSGSPLAAGTNPEALTVDPAGRYVYVANAETANQVVSYAIAPTSGALTLVSAAQGGNLPIAIAVDPSGQFLYASNFNSNDVSAYTISAAGVLSAVAGSPFAVGAQPHAIAID